MPSQIAGTLRRGLAAFVVLLLATVTFLVAQRPTASAEARTSLASRFKFQELPIKLPPGLPQSTVRAVNPDYEHIRSWISSVGAAISINDLDGQNVANDMCLVDTRSDAVIVTPAPDSAGGYEPFVLYPDSLPMGRAIAPMGCTPGDFNEDGWNDLLVYYWGRTPALFLNRGQARPLANDSFLPTELVPNLSTKESGYQGKLWNTNAINVADFDGDGHVDIGVFNYFPDSQVLDPQGLPGVQMNHTMSRATNAGGAHVLRWKSGTSTAVAFEEQLEAIPHASASGWTLGAGSADIDGDLLPELYLANDFGQDRFFHNVSWPGRIRFKLAEGQRDATTPKSLVVGHDSFKGMSMEFGDLLGTGKFDMFVSNITASWGLEESNLVWVNNATTPTDAKNKMDQGIAPFDAKAAELNMAWVGWGWDAKIADLDNSGRPSVLQACGFVKGTTNRFNWLQELAMANDLLLQEPKMWPKAEPGDDIAGSEPMAFWVREPNGRFVNLSHELGLDVPIPTRGIAIGDTNGDGAQDFAIARQWGPPAYYRNGHPGDNNYLGLRLYRPTAGAPSGASNSNGPIGTPAYGAQVRITMSDGRTQVARLDGGSGHSGRRSFDIFFGLGDAGGKPVSAEISWRDLSGAVHIQTLNLSSGWHNFLLSNEAQEVKAS
jgi:hypothetical protein